jgi:hypothetical protein
MTFGCWSRPSIENTVRGKVLASPKSRLWWVLWICVCSWFTVHQKCSYYTLTNLLFGLCGFMWVIDLLVTLLNPYFGALARPSTLEVLRAKEHTPTPHFFIIFTWDSHLNLLKSMGVRHVATTPTFLLYIFKQSHMCNKE